MGISAEIKWPNDVLVSGKKISGVLAEGDWIGDELTAITLGIGVNVRPESVPPENELSFPATCVEAEYGENINRTRLLRDILGALLTWRGRIQTPAFVETWAERLAFLGRDVVVSGAGALFQGQIIGLTEAGSLTVRAGSGEQQDFQVGEVRLRPS
jgi:BirA family biotin operon repressor/biotin-[acetyl-CoA-carboxylase] ligase